MARNLYDVSVVDLFRKDLESLLGGVSDTAEELREEGIAHGPMPGPMGLFTAFGAKYYHAACGACECTFLLAHGTAWFHAFGLGAVDV